MLVDGVRVRRLIDLGTSYKPAARKILKRRLAELDAEEAGTAAAAVTTLSDFAEAWFEKRELLGKRSVGTDRVLFDSYWKRPLGDAAIADVSQTQVHAVLDDLGSGRLLGVKGKRLSRASVRHVHGVLSRIFRSAVSAQVVKANPVSAIELADVLPKADKRRRAVLTDAEIARFLAHPDADLEIKMLVLMSRTVGGMRAGDLNALDWSAFGSEFATCVVPRCKTDSPQGLDVPHAVRPFLDAWWRRQGCPAAGAVFPVRRGRRAGEGKKKGNMSYAKRLRRELKRAFGVQRRVDGKWQDKLVSEWTERERELFTETETTRPVDFHSTRRAYATGLARANVNAQTAQVLSGHSDAKVHQRYVAAATITALPEAAAPDLSAVDPQKAMPLPFAARRDRRTRSTKVESHRFHDGFLGRGEKIRTSDPLTPSQVR